MFSQSRRRLKNLITNTEGRLKLIILIAGGVILSALIVFSAYRQITSPGFCALCHEMQPEYVTWQASVHSNFSCTDCHVDKSITKNIVNVTTRVYKHFTGTFNQPIEMTSLEKNAVCKQCHSLQRTVSPPGDLVFPHQKHVNKGFDCIQCHTGVTHGNIDERGYTTLTDYSKWTVGVGKAYMDEKSVGTSMDTCISCHSDNNVSTACSTCHSGIGSPTDHLQSNWKEVHGKKAEQDITYCDKCHSTTDNYVRFGESSSPAASYARNNTFCSKCHVGMEGTAKDFPVRGTQQNSASKRGNKATESKPLVDAPPSHVDGWRQIHGPQALANKAGCLLCHDEVKNPKANSTTTYCAECHQSRHNPGPLHPINLAGQKLNPSCYRCHSAKSCNKCHDVKMP